jgi:anti-sigma regulatory factor (Ser/Thr protein kinase)
MHQASGDFVGVFRPEGSNSLRVIAGDVSGHDLRAAYFSTFAQGVLRGMMQFNASDQHIFEFFNRFLTSEWNTAPEVSNLTSIALCGLEIDQQSRRIKLINGGFPIPCLIDREGTVSKLGIGSCPLGWFDEENFEIDIIRAPEGSFLYLWSDGLEDYAEHQGISVFAMAHRLLSTPDPRDQREILRDAIDDIMVVKLEVNPEDNTGEESDSTGFVPLLHKKFAGDESHLIDRSQHWIESSLKYAVPNIDAERLYDLVLCTREALLNAMVHGCASKPDRFCDLTATFNPSRKVVRIRIEDSGSGHGDTYLTAMDPELRDPNPLDRHTGFILMRELPDNIATERGGAVVTMDFTI